MQAVTPPSLTTLKSRLSSSPQPSSSLMTKKHSSAKRRTRVPYSEQEVVNLKQGVKKLGKFWNQILVTYKFHPTRTSVDLKDKYKQLMVKLC